MKSKLALTSPLEFSENLTTTNRGIFKTRREPLMIREVADFFAKRVPGWDFSARGAPIDDPAVARDSELVMPVVQATQSQASLAAREGPE